MTHDGSTDVRDAGFRPESLSDTVTSALELLVRASEPYEGLVPSLLDRTTGVMLSELPPHVVGQRDGDRAHRGANLSHDQPLLAALRGLGAHHHRPDLVTSTSRYLDTWTDHATKTPTGLFAWGEHSYTDLDTGEVGNSYVSSGIRPDLPTTHDHLVAVPSWLWYEIDQRSHESTLRFSSALDLHFKQGLPAEYTRHARMLEHVFPNRGPRSCDFPRHLGFYLQDWAFASTVDHGDAALDQVRSHAEYWWTRRDARGLLRLESRSPADDARSVQVTPPQTLSLAASLADAAALIDRRDAELAAKLREQASALTNSFLELHSGAWPRAVWLARLDTGEPQFETPLWGSEYEAWPSARVALIACARFRQSGDARLLDWAQAVGHAYAATPIPQDRSVPAIDAGLALELLSDLGELTGSDWWDEVARRLAGEATAVFFGEAVLPRGATDADWYESQLGTAHLLHGLTRVVLRDGAGISDLVPNYSAR